MKAVIHLLAGFAMGMALVYGLYHYATWRDESMPPIEEAEERPDCEIVREKPHRTKICGGPSHWIIPGHTI